MANFESYHNNAIKQSIVTWALVDELSLHQTKARSSADDTRKRRLSSGTSKLSRMTIQRIAQHHCNGNEVKHVWPGGKSGRTA